MSHYHTALFFFEINSALSPRYMLNTCQFNICLGHCSREPLHYVYAVRTFPVKCLFSILCCFCLRDTYRGYWSVEAQEKSLGFPLLFWYWEVFLYFSSPILQWMWEQKPFSGLAKTSVPVPMLGVRVIDLSLSPTSPVRRTERCKFPLPSLYPLCGVSGIHLAHE